MPIPGGARLDGGLLSGISSTGGRAIAVTQSCGSSDASRIAGGLSRAALLAWL